MKIVKSFGIVLTSLCVMAASAETQSADKLRFATVGIGSSWYIYGAGIADLVKPKLSAGSSIDVLPIAGGIGNLKLVQKGEAELGLTFPMPSAEACGGFGTFKSKQDNVRALLGGLDIYYFGAFATRKSGATSWNDIASGKNGFRLLTAKVGGTGEVGVRQVLGLLGSSKKAVAEKGGSVKSMARKATGSAISDGKADGWSHVVTKGHPVATQLTTTNDMVMIGLSNTVAAGMVKKFGWIRATVPANTFKGQPSPVPTVKAATNIVINKNVSNEVAYAFVKTMLDNAMSLKKIHAALGNFKKNSAAEPGFNGNCPFHPGAVKAYKEAGLM